jgi:hypothetical protein
MSILAEKNGGGRSAGRVIAIGFAVIFAFRLMWMTVLGMALGWPDAVFGAAVVFAVPLHRLFAGRGGKEIALELFRAFGRGNAGTNAAPEAVKAIVGKLPDLFADDER